jgi:hypothetical protein
MMLHWMRFLLRQSSYKILEHRTLSAHFTTFAKLFVIQIVKNVPFLPRFGMHWRKRKKKDTENNFCWRSQRDICKYTQTQIQTLIFPKVIHRLQISTCLFSLSSHYPSNSFSAIASQIPFIHLTLVLPRFLLSGSKYTRVEQNNGNITYTVHISFLIWCSTKFCLQ